ncbi:MAG: hypothetical protein EBR82_64505 [Caulobacteraceae bacterium]|nr:hypothetical protein [Caulobacteraceae bacterium]
MANVVVSAIATFNGKALKKGQKEISAFDKQTQKLGKTFAKVFGTIAVASFAKNAVNAFIDSEKAAAKLRTTVKNLGLEFEQPGIEDYLKSLSLQFGIVDENLIPGFQRLLIVTKDVAKAQSLFETALNVSAGTGKDLTTVATSLSKAYLGDNAALGRLGVGLSKAQLKSASFLEVQRTLNLNFAGQAQAAVAGYAGSMAKLTVAVDESKEAIGKGLLDALAALTNSSDINTFTIKMVSAAEKIGQAFAAVGDVIGLLNPNATVKVGGRFIRKSDVNAPRLSPATSRAILLKKETKATNDLVSAKKAETAAIKAKSEVDKLKDKFDIERIGLTLALNQATDEETKLRLRAQLAILDNNEALAKKYNAELEAKRATDQLTVATDNAAAALNRLSSSPALFTATGAMTGRALNQIAPFGSTDLQVPYGVTNQGATAAASAPVVINVPVNAGTIIAEQELQGLITDTVRVALKSGNKLIPAGGIA